MSHRDQLKNPLYRNWVRGALALKYLKHGLEVYIDQSLQTQHSIFIGRLPSSGATNIPCGQCTIDNVLPDHFGSKCKQKSRSRCLCNTPRGRRKCPSSYCSLLIDLLIQEHWLKDPVWCNINLSKLPSHYWELAKCFLSSPCKSNASSSKDTDVSDLLSIAINDSYIRKNIQTIGNFRKAREIRNALVHTTNYELSDTELANYIQTFIDVLLDATLVHSHAAQNAVKDLNQLKTDNIFISTEDVEDMRTYALSAIDERKEETLQEIQNTEKQTVENITQKMTIFVDAKFKDLSNKIDFEKCEMFYNLKTQMDAEMNNIKDFKADSIADIKKQITQRFVDHTADCIKHISKQFERMREHYLREVKQYTANLIAVVLEDFDKYRFSKLCDIDMKTQKSLTEIKENEGQFVKHANEKLQNITRELQEMKNKIIMELQKVVENKGIQQQLLFEGNLGTNDAPSTNEQDANLLSPVVEEDHYQKLKHDFQTDLVSYYRCHHAISTISLTQFSRKYDAPLLQVFEFPNMMFRYNDGLKSRTAMPVHSYKDILLHGSKPVHNVFISGPSGTGKTVLTRHLCLTWCQTHRQENLAEMYFPENDIATLKHFDFLFILNLSTSGYRFDLFGLIKNQIVGELPCAHRYDRNFFLQNVLTRERCLIIFDDLDKWNLSNPVSESRRLPHISTGHNITTVSVVNHWKSSLNDLNFKQMDMKVEVIGSTKVSFSNMSRRTIDYLNATSEKQKNAEEFLGLVTYLDIEYVALSKIGHMYLLGRWFEDRIPCASRSVIFGFLTEELYSRGKICFVEDSVGADGCTELIEMIAAGEQNLDKSPVRYNGPKQFCPYTKALLKLGELSFECLPLSPSDGVDLTRVKHFLSSDEFQFCLDMGILCLNVNKRLTSNTASISFQNQTFQAYFAALYTSKLDSTTNLKEVIGRFCVSVRKRNVSLFLVFLAGLNPNILSEISRYMYDFCHDALQEYRNGLDVGSVIEHRIRSFQNVMVKCVREMFNHKEVSLTILPHLEDIFIDEACENAEYLCVLNHLIIHNKDQIKSVTLYHGQLSQQALTSVEILSIPSPQTLVVLSKRCGQTTLTKPVLFKCQNETLLNVIQSLFLKSAGNLECVSLGGISLSLQNIKSILDSQRLHYVSMNQVQISDGNWGSRASRISLKVGVSKSYMYLCGNVNNDLIGKMALLQTVKLQNICISPSQLDLLAKLDKVNILHLWHIQLSHPAGHDAELKIPKTFDVAFDRQQKNICVRGKVPNVFINTFFTSNYGDIENVKVVFVYLTFQSLCSLCSIKRPKSVLLKGITLISETDEHKKSRYFEMRKTFKCELISLDEKLLICGSAPEKIYSYLMSVYAESVKKIDLRDMVLSESDLEMLAGIKNMELFTLVNITRKPGDRFQQLTILNTFDMIFMKEEQKLYVCGDISECFLRGFIVNYIESLQKVDLRYVGQTTVCFNSFTMLKDLRELSVYFCRSDFEDTLTLIALLNALSESLELVRLGCLSLLSKHLAVNNMQQTESMSIREIIHSSKTKDSKRDQDFASLNESYCIQWDCKSKSLYIEGETPEDYVNHFLQKHASCTTVHLKRLSLSQSDLLELSKADNLKILKMVDTTCQGETENDIDMLSSDDEDSEIGEEYSEADPFFDENSFSDEIHVTNKNLAIGADNKEINSDNDKTEISDDDSEFDRNQEDNRDVDTKDTEPEYFDGKSAMDVEICSQKYSERKSLSIQFEHYEEKLFVSGEFTDPLLFQMLLNFFTKSKEVKLINVKLRHKRAKELFSSIDMKTDLERIEIEDVKCFDHENCIRIKMNLSEHVFLQSLSLKSTHITSVRINGAQLHTCKLDSLVVPGIVASVLENLQPNVISTLELISVRDGTDIDAVTKVIPTLKGLRSLEICWVSINTNFSLFPHLKQLDYLVLRNVKMSLEGYLSIISNAHRVKKTIRVRFSKCQLSEKSDAKVFILKDSVSKAIKYKTEEEWTCENGLFSGVYNI